MSLNHPFTPIEDGHNITGIMFDTPVPWPRWESASGITSNGDDDMADRIAAAIDPAPEEQRPQSKLDCLIDVVEGEASLDHVREALGEVLIKLDALSGMKLLDLLKNLDDLREHVQEAVNAVRTASDELNEAVADAKK